MLNLTNIYKQVNDNTPLIYMDCIEKLCKYIDNVTFTWFANSN